MPSFAVHLAVATIYLDKHKNEDKNDFIKGTIDVDITEDTYKAHYTGNSDKSVLATYLKEKVIIKNYVIKNEIITSYDRGYFLHLLVDYYFYTSYFGQDYINKTSYADFKKALYHDWPIYNEYLKQKYKFEIPKKVDIYPPSREKPLLLRKSQLDEFIREMGRLDLDALYKNFKDKMKISFHSKKVML